MTWNKVFTKVAVKSIVKDGVNVPLSAATQTKNFMRPEAFAITIAKSMKELIIKSENIPEGTKEFIVREGLHSSEGDPVPHSTAVCIDELDEHEKTTTVHVYPASK